MAEILLEPISLNKLELKNRFVMAPMGTNLGQPNGHVNHALMDHYEARAKGGVGLITVEMGGIDFPYGLAIPNTIAISDEAFLPGLTSLAEVIKKHGAKASIQIHHAGPMAANDFSVGNSVQLASHNNHQHSFEFERELSPQEQAIMVGNLNENAPEPRFHVLEKSDITALVEKYANAIALVKKAGFDAVEIQAGHGYLLASFLSPYWNQRKDEYGGSTENRLRILKEIFHACQKKIGHDFPIAVRLNGIEYDMPGGVELTLAVEHAKACEVMGAAAIHVTAFGHPESAAAFGKGPIPTDKNAYLTFASAIKHVVSIPVIAVGRLDTNSATKAVDAGDCDLVAMARPLLADPELVNKLSKKASIKPCINCDSCVGEIFLNRTARCVLLDAKEDVNFSGRSILIKGFGSRAIRLAARLAKAGANIELLIDSKTHVLGAGEYLHIFSKNDAYLSDYRAYLERLSLHKNIHIRTSKSTQQVYDAVLDFTINTPLLKVEGINRTLHAFTDVLEDYQAYKDKNVVIIGSNQLGFYLAEFLARSGIEVAIVQTGGCFGESLSLPKRWHCMKVLRDNGVGFMQVTDVDDSHILVSALFEKNESACIENYELNQEETFLSAAMEKLTQRFKST